MSEESDPRSISDITDQPHTHPQRAFSERHVCSFLGFLLGTYRWRIFHGIWHCCFQASFPFTLIHRVTAPLCSGSTPVLVLLVVFT